MSDARIGNEDFQWKVFANLFSYVNDELAIEEAAAQAGIDAAYDTLTGRGFGSLSLELFNTEFIHYGHRPSMIEAPVSEYPSLAVFGFRATRAGSQPIDQGTAINNQVAVEAIVKSDAFTEDDKSGRGEDQVNRRIHRTAEAINAAIVKNMGGEVDEGFGPIAIVWGEIFARREEAGHGSMYFWQGVRMEYVFSKQNIPDFSADIDQF